MELASMEEDTSSGDAVVHRLALVSESPFIHSGGVASHVTHF